MLGQSTCLHVMFILQHQDERALSKDLKKVKQNKVTINVNHLVEDLHHKGHVIMMDNFFTSIELLRDSEAKSIYATCTLRNSRICLPKALTNSEVFAKRPQGL